MRGYPPQAQVRVSFIIRNVTDIEIWLRESVFWPTFVVHFPTRNQRAVILRVEFRGYSVLRWSVKIRTRVKLQGCVCSVCSRTAGDSTRMESQPPHAIVSVKRKQMS
jgi:hypothetical protein